MVELLFPRTLSEDMKDVFILPRGLGLRGVQLLRFVTSLIYLVYYGFLTLSTPRTDIHPRYPERSSIASEPTAARQDIDASFQKNHHREAPDQSMHYSSTLKYDNVTLLC